MSVLFTEIVRAQTKPYWEGSFLHPFLTELQVGTLPMEKFRYYLIQDCYYLTHFARLYALVAERTVIPELAEQMGENGAHLAEGELQVRAYFFQQLGIDEKELQETAIAPTAYHYVSHMYRQLVEANDWVTAASLLPCSWLYAEIGQTLVQAGIQSPNPYYQQWIETYGGEENAIAKECALLNRLYQESSQEQQEQMVTAFVISAKMEYAFWEMAYQLEEWPTGMRE